MAEPETSSPINEDQAAVAQYFASAQYAEIGHRHKDRSVPRRPAALIDRFSFELDSDRGLSAGMGFWGLGTCLLVTAMWVPHGAYFMSGTFNQSFGLWMFLVQITYAPAIACLTLISVTASLWYIPILRRFGMASMTVLPGLLMAAFGLLASEDVAWRSFWPALPLTMLAFMASAATVALPIQMWGQRSLSHARDQQRRLPPMSTRSIMELTLIASGLFAFGVARRSDEILLQMLVAAVIGAIASAAVLSLMLTRLRSDRRGTYVGIMLSWIFSMAAMFVMSLFAFSRYEETIQWFSSGQQTTVIAVTSFLGSLMLYGLLEAGRWWLRACGWQCVTRTQWTDGDG